MAFDTILAGHFPPSADDREALAAFIALQWVRGPDMRDAIQQSETEFLRFMAMNMPESAIRAGWHELEGEEPTQEEVDDMVAYLADPETIEVSPHPNSWLRQIANLLEEFTVRALNREWQLLRAESGSFVTCDAPVTLWSPDSTRHMGVGFGTAAEVALAIDRHHALVLALRAPSGEISRGLGALHVNHLNARTAANGYRWVVCHPDDGLPSGIQLAPPRPRMRVSLPMGRIVPSSGDGSGDVD